MGCQTRRDKKRHVLWKPRWYYDRRRKTRSCMLPKEREAKIFLVLVFPQSETWHNPSSPSTLSSFQSLCVVTIHLLSAPASTTSTWLSQNLDAGKISVIYQFQDLPKDDHFLSHLVNCIFQYLSFTAVIIILADTQKSVCIPQLPNSNPKLCNFLQYYIYVPLTNLARYCEEESA